jgi:cell division protein FtsL
MSLSGFFERRVRGVRVIELWAGGLTLVLALGVYLAKTGAGDEGADIARTQNQIVQEQRQIRLLKAEVAYLEQPRRLERLSAAYLGLQPMSGKRETVIENLQEVARTGVPAAQPAVAPVIPDAAAPAGGDPETPVDDAAPTAAEAPQ